MPLTEQDIETIERIVDHLKTAKRIFFVTGAGISADSGLPTYRGIGGLYNSGRTEEGLAIEDVLSGDTLRLNPALTWKYLRQIEESCRGASFNRAHEVIADMQREFDRVVVLTQNIDGFHQAAGSRVVIDIHGGLHNLECMTCDYETSVPDYRILIDFPPVCPSCGGVVRPAVVLFGEPLPLDRIDMIMDEWREDFDIVFSVGTTSVFPYITQPVAYAKTNDIPTVEINPGDTPVTPLVDFKIPAGAAETLDVLWTRYLESRI
ncbi:NAD-dependent deacetylase [Candidatus Latescibacterota bacterium]